MDKEAVQNVKGVDTKAGVTIASSGSDKKTANSDKQEGGTDKKILTQAVNGTSASAFVTKKGRQLFLNGSEFQSVGVNRYNLLTVGGEPYIGCAGVFSDIDLSSWFSEVKNMGATTVRLWLFQSFTKDATDFTRFDRVLELAQDNGIKIIPVLENQWTDCTEGGYKDDSWYKEGYKSTYGSYALSYREYVARVVSAYKNDPTIMLWQLMNEAEADHQALYAFAEDMSGVVKSQDANHLVSLGTIGSGQKGAQESQYRSIHTIPSIDIVEYHDYHHDELAFPDYDNFNSLKVRISDSITLDKPIIIGESGIKANCSEDNCYTVSKRADLFQAKMEAFFNRGGAAYLLWSYRDHAGATPNPFDFLPGDPLVNVIRNQTAQF